MKKGLLLFSFILSLVLINAQSVSCEDLADFIIKNQDRKDTVTPITSSMLAKATWYEYDGKGFVIAFLKSSDYDFKGRPYIFCGIEWIRWFNFKYEGLKSSYGKAFHEYIIDYTCNCE